ncbi:hypothetical protein ACFO4E_08070 [Nocardiopsis mangrovi]|uniref:Uncharacterized protein n=1 Tax=Nocardiopsis mangrovi TaxID=1179818 RepID=A0ABV9DSF0_9ACTN
MIDPALLTLMLVITLGGIGVVIAAGVAYIADDALRRRETAAPEPSAASPAPAAERREQPA